MINMVKRSGLIAIRDVIIALLIRELKTRFGWKNLGYVWLVFGPVMQAFPIYFLRVFQGKTPEETILFLITGLLTMIFFASSISKSESAISSNINLFSFAVVKPFDVIFTRVLLEFIIFMCGGAFFIFIHYLVHGEVVKINSMLYIISLCVLLFLLTFFLSVIIGVFVKMFDFLSTPVSVISRALYLASGIFFTINELPKAIRDIILLNPLAHIIDLLRHNIMENYISKYSDINYCLFFTLCLGLCACAVYTLYRERMLISV